MKRWLILAAAVVALSSAATVALQYLPEAVPAEGTGYPVGARNDPAEGKKKDGFGRPRAVVEGERTFAFGTLPQQTTGKHSWVVRNEGKGVLELWMISSTCSCTLAKFKDGSKAYVKPGESTEITLEYETRVANGDYEKGAQIGTNDPDLPEFPLHVRGKVYPAVMTIPALEGGVVNLTDIRNEEDHHVSKIGIYSKDRPETKIVKASSSDPKNIDLSWEPVKGEELASLNLKSCERLTIDVKSDMPLGPFRHEVVVTTDHPLQSEVRLTVTGTLLGPINLDNPGRLMLHNPPVDGKRGGQGEIGLTVAESRPTRFEVVRTPRGLTARVVPEANPRLKGHYRLVVGVPPGTPAQNIVGRVELKTDHPKGRTVFVPVSVWVQNSPQ